MVTWYRLLESAKSPFEVVMVARDYLATWAPEEISSLPPNVRPGKLVDEGDIEELHSALVEAFRDSKASGTALAALQRLTSFMVRATIRISELSEAGSTGEPAGDSKAPRSAASRREH
jgi:hypothetical protein